MSNSPAREARRSAERELLIRRLDLGPETERLWSLTTLRALGKLLDRVEYLEVQFSDIERELAQGDPSEATCSMCDAECSGHA